MKKLLILMAISAFGWFAVRPAVIRRDCVKVVRQRVDNESMSIKKGNLIYRECLATWGMKPEDLAK
jgi:hypothetical protein